MYGLFDDANLSLEDNGDILHVFDVGLGGIVNM